MTSLELSRAGITVKISGKMSRSEQDALSYEVTETLRSIDNLRTQTPEKNPSNLSIDERKEVPLKNITSRNHNAQKSKSGGKQ